MSKKLLICNPKRSYNIYAFRIWSVKNEWSLILEANYVS